MSTRSPRNLRDAVRRLLVAHGALASSHRPCGTPLPLPHAYALIELLQTDARGDAPMTVSDLAARLLIDRTNVSRLCARMQEQGHVTRTIHPTDTRARCILLTAAGRDLAEHVDNQSAAHFAGLGQQLEPDTPAVIRALDHLTTAMVRARATNGVSE